MKWVDWAKILAFVLLFFLALMPFKEYIFSEEEIELTDYEIDSVSVEEVRRMVDKDTNFVTSSRISHAPDVNVKYLEYLLKRFVRKARVAGASVAVMKNGRLVYQKGFGYANKEKKEKMEPYHMLRVASISKLLTATAIMMLVEQKKLKLTDKVFGPQGILRWGVYKARPRDRRMYKITVAHLLQHTAGWDNADHKNGDFMFDLRKISWNTSDALPLHKSSIVEYAFKQKLYASPGKDYSYSNFGYFLLGEIIALKGGTSYENFIRQKILIPSGIDKEFHLAKTQIIKKHPLEVKYYDYRGADYTSSVLGLDHWQPRPYASFDLDLVGAAGAWAATTSGLLKFLRRIDPNDQCPDLLSAESLAEMTTVNSSLKKFAYGWSSTNAEAWWRTGTLSGTSALMVRKKNGISYIVLLNTGSDRGYKFAKDVQQLMEKALYSVKYWGTIDLFEPQYLVKKSI
ncbi:MAG: class A beta-lactamase-related serine hydrolase [Cytophagales bacterium]|nr:MAG: class A beta-lactamase-related serine hydrolase [Cytophagales bacterium]TAF59966.1 MAG: class A beta-lactamase-related serine hydrolase [Cytophagales bacterium]